MYNIQIKINKKNLKNTLSYAKDMRLLILREVSACVCQHFIKAMSKKTFRGGSKTVSGFIPIYSNSSVIVILSSTYK